MQSIFKRMALAICAAAFGALPAIAQQDQTRPYGQVKGWKVHSIQIKGKGFSGCRAAKSERGHALWLGLRGGTWRLVAPSRQHGRFTGGILSVDKADMDVQFGLNPKFGLAIKELSANEFDAVRRGLDLGVRLNGEQQMYWSLNGSAAAILKVQECVQRKGKPVGQQRANGQKNGKPTPPNLSNPRQTKHFTCDAPTALPYACRVTRYEPSKGFLNTFRVVDQAGNQPSYVFNVRSDTVSQVWVSFTGGAPWKFIGVWASKGKNDPCANPRAKQGKLARRNMGQDAWGLCIR